MRIVVMQGQSAHDALRYFSRILADGFARAGHEVVLWDLLRWSSRDYAALFADFSPHFTVGFNPIAYIGTGGNVHFTVTNTPHIIYLVDPITFHLGGRALMVPNDPMLCTVFWPRAWAAASQRAGIRAFDVVPFGADPRLADRHTPETPRPIPALFVGAIADPDEVLRSVVARHANSETLRDLIPAFLDAVDHHLTETGELLPAPLDDVFVNMVCPDMTPKEQTDILTVVHADIERYYRHRVRLHIVRGLVERGVPLTVVGNEAWRELVPGARVLDNMPYREAVETTAMAKVVLSICPTMFDPHDRVFPAMMSGTAVFTTPVPLFTQEHPEAAPLLPSIGWGNLDAAAARMNGLIGDRDERIDIARRGQDFARRELDITKSAAAMVRVFARRWPG